MNLSDSKKKLALAGVICGVVAACLTWFGNPANMAFCIACFIRDRAGALGLHSAETGAVCKARDYRSCPGSIHHLRGDKGVSVDSRLISHGAVRPGNDPLPSVPWYSWGVRSV